MRFLFVIIILFLFFDFAKASLKDTVIESYNASEFIFIGKIKGMNASDKPGERVYEIDVVEIYKGKRWATIMLIADTSKFDFSLKKEYLIYSGTKVISGKKGKKKKSSYLIPYRSLPVDNDAALPDVKELVKILDSKFMGRIKSPRAKIIFRKCNCVEEKM